MDLMPDASNSEPTRDELVARLQLMETMVAEGRRATGRYGWVFVLWGLVDVGGVIWQTAKPHWFGVWPITIGCGVVLQLVGLQLFCRNCTPTLKNRALSSIWRMMGVTLCLYCFSAMFTHHGGGIAYLAAIFMILGMSHSISALILRWWVQGCVGAMWLAGGVVVFVVPGQWLIWLFLAEMIVGMVLFGLYAMLLEGRRSGGTAVHG